MAGSLKEAFQEMGQVGMPDIVVGVVTGTDPISITLKDNLKINLSAASLIIPSEKNPLLLGEQFYLLSVNNKKIYYVMDRM